MIERYHIKERNDISIEVKKSEREEKIECEGVACNSRPYQGKMCVRTHEINAAKKVNIKRSTTRQNQQREKKRKHGHEKFLK